MTREITNLGTTTLDCADFEIDGNRYTLYEPTGEVVRQYRNSVLNGATIGPDGKPQKLEGAADADSLLVALCLRDSDGKNVSLATVRGWPNRIQTPLADKARELGGLDLTEDEVTETAKN